ncbi:hypothetical protein [Gluconobacter thailandicus]|uniref:Uncharacterized protein n=1 Tax=Gluconobacter thailandicus TaxID=257438 RepID=A0AAP9ET46_GLUTH|nr:hypothetical protein [Gluconobacter thailandicus]QEH97326.1 hypothetical protein FXF46_14490 [Gluconobacter thailandicus]
MSEMKPVAWCLMTDDMQIINGVHEEARLAEQYRHRRAVDTLTPLYTAAQLAEAVAAERERNAKLSDEVASQCGNLIGNIVRSVSQAIRSAAK